MSSQYFRFTARATEPLRSPILEQLIARADGCAAVSDWRAEAFELIAPAGQSMPAVAAAVLAADRGAADGAWVCLATPVHYIAEMNTVRLAGDGMLSLTPACADTLASDFNRVLGGDGFRLTATRSAQLIGLFDRARPAATHDPQDVQGCTIEQYLPTGLDSAALRRLMSEMEMWLFEHAINKVRSGAGQPVISGLWLWGGGALLPSLPRIRGWTAGDDVFFNGWSASQEGRSENGVIAVNAAPESRSWREAEARWLKPASARLKDGTLSTLKLSAGERCFTVTARGMRRFWRRARPWQESLQ